jgi:hypothetical protein
MAKIVLDREIFRMRRNISRKKKNQEKDRSKNFVSSLLFRTAWAVVPTRGRGTASTSRFAITPILFQVIVLGGIGPLSTVSRL